jgi:hypothetical protein
MQGQGVSGAAGTSGEKSLCVKCVCVGRERARVGSVSVGRERAHVGSVWVWEEKERV